MNPAPGATLLEVRNLVKHYPVRKGVFSRISGAVHAGLQAGIPVHRDTGSSGPGKTGCAWRRNSYSDRSLRVPRGTEMGL